MEDRLVAGGFLVVGLALATYGIRGILKRRITAFFRGRMPRVCVESEAVSYGIVVTTFGCGSAVMGGLLLLATFR
jgi:hypothetical protein